MRSIAFIGIGNMGWPMATNIVRAGFRLTVFDVDRERQEQLAKTLSCGCAAQTCAPGLAESTRPYCVKVGSAAQTSRVKRFSAT